MVITTTDLQLFQILKENNEANLKVLATKEDIAKLTMSTKEDTAKLDLKISESKADMIKWMFIFWTGSILTTLGGLFAFLKIFLDK